MNYKIVISYDGSRFHGFQRQTESIITVQSELEKAIRQLFCDNNITVSASGRTDIGVHALNQVVAFKAEKAIVAKNVPAALNAKLCDGIRVVDAEIVDDNFNPRICAKTKTYFYDMYVADTDLPLLYGRATRLNKKTDAIDMDLMQKGAELFIGKHDFKAFRCKGSSALTTVRTVKTCFLTKEKIYDTDIIRLTISADGFLYKMVRIIVGTLIKLSNGSISLSDIENLLKDGQEWEQKFAAPSDGLYLAKVEY